MLRTPQRLVVGNMTRLSIAFILIAFSSLAEVDFQRDIWPILSDRCFSCHGPDSHDREAKLRLDRADGPEGAYRTNRDDLHAIKPGALLESELWYRISTDDPELVMPPPKAHKPLLSPPEQALFKEWIESGAKYEAFWAFVPPQKPEPDRNSIDALVRERLKGDGLKAAAQAEKRALVRRGSFDLTGLPPSPEEIHAFLADDSPDAWEHLVDGLISRSAYGEHMARYWLDLVRFADTNGMHKDFYRHMSPYREWVIRAFNDNLSYADFLRYQLAGDLFAEPSTAQLLASGFNRLHLIIDRGTALPEESFFKNVVDRVTAVGTAFMGLTVNCAQCHDHKYDPLTQKDFYSLYAFFNNIDANPETAGRPRGGIQPPYIFLSSPEQKAELAKLEAAVAAADAKTRKAASKKRDDYKNRLPKAMVMKERATPRDTFVMKRGQYDAPGDSVQRATPGFLPPLSKSAEFASRMDLAEWFVDPRHPLTARVAVNRFWQQFFGVGLVKTSEDLGAQGEMPSHPELLDMLSVGFVESGWDIKALLKRIVMSETYRQRSIASAAEFANDPENRLLARGSRYRMDAEMIRDQILATSGLLVPTLYGPSVKPPQPDGLWKAVTMTGERFKQDSGDAIYRRSLYTYWKRGMPPPQMTILNAPNRDACIARRERTNTPSQALLLLNESEYLKAARALAQKVREQPEDKRMAYAYEVVTSRLPDDAERAILTGMLDDLQTRYAETPALADDLCKGLDLPAGPARAELASWTVLVSTLYNLDISKTRE
ncbi:MAG: hypothetical protein ACI8W8_001146 [Rhodothermales bacterium]|jgi:hypothetical protein